MRAGLSVGRADVSGLLAAAGRARAAACGAVAENVLADCGPYVPYDTGALKRSGEAVPLRGGGAEVRWGTDADTAAYAREQYYNEGYRHKTEQNALFSPRAQSHWFEGARAERREEWERMYRTVYGGGLHG